MTDGNWEFKINGYGKIDPGGDSDEIQELVKLFKIELQSKGHTEIHIDIGKHL